MEESIYQISQLTMMLDLSPQPGPTPQLSFCHRASNLPASFQLLFTGK